MLGGQLKTIVKTTLSFLKVCEDGFLERVDVGKTTVIFNLLLQPDWLDIITCMYLERVFTNKNTRFRKGLEAGLSKQQVSNVFNSQEASGDKPPLIAIEKYSGARNGKIRADFYGNCQDIPDPSALDDR